MFLFGVLVFLSSLTLLLVIISQVFYLSKLPEFNYSFNESFPILEITNLFIKSERINFDEFDNQTGANQFIVPNIIHYIRFNKKSWSFVEYMCLHSAFVNQRPDYIFIHTNVVDNSFKGKFWNRIQEEFDLKSRIVFEPAQPLSKIFGQKLNSNWKLYHSSDVIRIQVLMKYGGIFLDNDAFVIHNLNKYRKFEMTLGWPQNESFGTMVLIANKNARFLQLWLENYRNYKADKWYFNAGDNPTRKLLMKHPQLVHREETRFGVQFMMREMYQTKKFNWDKLDTVHLLINHRRYLDMFFKDYRYFNERNILHYPFNFGHLSRSLKSNVVRANISN